MLVTVSELKSYMDISLTNRQHDAAEIILQGLQNEIEQYLGRPVEVQEFTEEHVIPTYFQGVPANSFFYDHGLDSTGQGVGYIQPSQIISLRNSPVTKVKKVSIRNQAQAPVDLAQALRRSATVTGATVSGQNVTYVAVNDFTVGQHVHVSGISPTTLNTPSGQVASATATEFTVKNSSASGTYVSGGSAIATGSDYVVHRYGIEMYRGFPNDTVEVIYEGGLDGSKSSVIKLTILRAATREMQNMHDDVVGVKDLNPRGVSVMDVGLSDRELFALNNFKRRRIT